MAKVALFIKTKTQSGKRDEVWGHWEQHLKARVEANAAQELYVFCYDNNDRDTFLLFEVYNDRAALDKTPSQTGSPPIWKRSALCWMECPKYI